MIFCSRTCITTLHGAVLPFSQNYMYVYRKCSVFYGENLSFTLGTEKVKCMQLTVSVFLRNIVVRYQYCNNVVVTSLNCVQP